MLGFLLHLLHLHLQTTNLHIREVLLHGSFHRIYHHSLHQLHTLITLSNMRLSCADRLDGGHGDMEVTLDIKKLFSRLTVALVVWKSSKGVRRFLVRRKLQSSLEAKYPSFIPKRTALKGSA